MQLILEINPIPGQFFIHPSLAEHNVKPVVFAYSNLIPTFHRIIFVDKLDECFYLTTRCLQTIMVEHISQYGYGFDYPVNNPLHNNTERCQKCFDYDNTY